MQEWMGRVTRESVRVGDHCLRGEGLVRWLWGGLEVEGKELEGGEGKSDIRP